MCWQGYIDQGLMHAAAAVERAADWSEGWVAAGFLVVQLRLLSLLHEPSTLAPQIEQVRKLAHEQRRSLIENEATIYEGWSIAHRGDPETGRSLLREGLAAYVGTETQVWLSFHHALLAETYQLQGDAEEALHILADALRLTERTGERWYAAELHRRIGEAHRQRGAEAAAHQSFDQALAIARSQGAKLWELQAATRFGRLLRDQGRPTDARSLLAPVYTWFSEGFDTVPLREGKALLEELA
jgi:predicted ATPase